MKGLISKFANKGKYVSWVVSLLLGVCVFLFWLLIHPEALSYQEQNQMFLWTGSYFLNDVSQPGGFADWLSEFIVQFYYIIWLGALLLACLFVLLQLELVSLFRHSSKLILPGAVIISLLVVLLMHYIMGDENVLLSLLVAMVLSLGAAILTRKFHWAWDLLIVPVLYWLAGPAVWLYVIASICFKHNKLQTVVPILLLVLQFVLAYTVLTQWPMSKVLTGLNYYRNYYFSLDQFSFGFDKDKYALLKEDWQVRNERWQDIIDDARKYQPQINFSSECVNLALAKNGQLAQDMFSFYQSGNDALLMPMIRDNMSNLPTMEAFWQLGMVNECMRYAFDIQESIMNGKKSGRLTKRIAECCIINGRYKTASKYLDMLQHTLFYSDWAKKAKTYLGNEAWINSHPEWGRIRQLRYKEDFLYNYYEMDKMLGILFQNNPQNKMALEYFLGQMLLLGNVQGFITYLGWAQQYGGYQSMPYGYQDAYQCIQSRGQAPNSLYGNYVKRMQAQAQADGGTGATPLAASAH